MDFPGMDLPQMDLPAGKRVALSIVVNVEEGSEMSVARGDAGMEPVDELAVFIKGPLRNYGNESNYRYGINAGAPRVLALLAEHGVPASWTVAAQALEQCPDLARAIVSLGHEPVSHGLRWVHQFKMDEAEERAFIRGAAESIERTTGIRPRGWLSRYMLTDNTRRLLIEEGFAYHMDDYSNDIPFWDRDTVAGSPIVVMPYQVDTNDMKMWVSQSYTPRQWLEYAIDALDHMRAEGTPGRGGMMSLGLHLRIIGRPGRFWALAKFMEHVAACDDVWIATRGQIRDRFAQQVPA
ncbi:polysaccharide deacetylase family protein [Sphingosinithalassobacter portus]|uniref:polysaccharide deacetylase family protein n=1 Tax=Stakelama portus TaxID=2676234 RepID=UPI001EFC87EA|nr:polysaccharide deacetylase family protein [Sphingosinithalassobacter portus]